MLRGLFIGIDRYRTPVTRLSCAVADANALGALFEDTLSGDAHVLTDEDATGESIRAELAWLQSAAADDTVVVTFSGHGTEDHRLVPVDVDPSDIPASCIALIELASALDAIPSRNLLVVLDCCFSGGFAAPAFLHLDQHVRYSRIVRMSRHSFEARAVSRLLHQARASQRLRPWASDMACSRTI